MRQILALSIYLGFQTMNTMAGMIPDAEARRLVEETRIQFRKVLDAHPHMMDTEHPTLICTVYDSGNLGVAPGMSLIPFMLPQSLEDLESVRHFAQVDHARYGGWYSPIAEEVYDSLPDPDVDSEGFDKGFDELYSQKIAILKEASNVVPGRVRVIALDPSSPYWMERAILVSGEPFPLQPPPFSSIDLFSRLARQNGLSFSWSCSGRFRNDILIGVTFEWARQRELQQIIETPKLGALLRDLEFLLVSEEMEREFRARLSPIVPHVMIITERTNKRMESNG